jgi:hypothetical protein
MQLGSLSGREESPLKKRAKSGRENRWRIILTPLLPFEVLD